VVLFRCGGNQSAPVVHREYGRAMARIDPPLSGPERDSLTSWLQYQRDTLVLKCEGLDPAQLCERSVPPSTMSLIGLVRHMAEVERNWFRRVLAGEGTDTAGPIYYSKSNPDGDFDDVKHGRLGVANATWPMRLCLGWTSTRRASGPDVDPFQCVGCSHT